jgi:predicted DNA-binding protein (MmcQ/YjbR family)
LQPILPKSDRLLGRSECALNIKAVKRYCASLPYANGEIKWDVDLVYTIGGKMFAVAFEDRSGNGLVSFKVDDERFLELTDREGFIPAPYLARAKWVQVTDLRAVADAELKSLIRRSHELVLAKLPRKVQTFLAAQ